MLETEIVIKANFYDLDPMGVVWHGNYARFFEQARCALLDRIGYNYVEMRESGYMWPIVRMNTKFIRPIRFLQEIRVLCSLLEYENRLRMEYCVLDAESGEAIAEAETVQVAVPIGSNELCFESPPVLLEKLQRLL